MSITQKAVRATITLGTIELDCYQMPDGSYFLSLTQVAMAIDIALKRMSELQELQLAQTLFPDGFGESGSIKVVGGTKPVKTISLGDASQYWTLAASRGNEKAFLLVAACAAEALERRADSAFGKVRTEQERNERFEQRQNHRIDFHPKFTAWLKLDGCIDYQYGLKVNEFKSKLRLPIATVDTYDSSQLRILDVAYIKYDTLRTTGISHDKALSLF